MVFAGVYSVRRKETVIGSTPRATLVTLCEAPGLANLSTVPIKG
jgi:hypothetical protein